MKLVNLNNEEVLADHLQEAYSFYTRLKGLMFTKELPSGCALHIKPCQSIHTFFMNYPIDVLYLDKHQKVVEVETNMNPNNIGRIVKSAASVIELPANTIEKTRIMIGDVVQIKK